MSQHAFVILSIVLFGLLGIKAITEIIAEHQEAAQKREARRKPR